MQKRMPCRRCQQPSIKALCDTCRAQTYGSNQYRQNSFLIRNECRRRLEQGIPIYCIICDQRITDLTKLTIEHRHAVGAGGTNALINLGPAHQRCNYGKTAAY